MQSAAEWRPPGWVRYLAAAGLFLLAPLVGEFLLGNLPITFLAALIALAPLYGGGALLIREIARRGGLGWPGMLMLCLAFGVVEEGFVTQSLFDPGYLGLGLNTHAAVPWVGIGAWWTVFVLGLHAVWSTAVPIALVETIVGPGRERAWLGWPGLVLAALLFAAGCAMTIMYEDSAFIAAPHQFAIAGLAVVALVVGAFRFGGRGPSAAGGAAAPSPLRAGAAAFVAGSIFVGAAYVRDMPNAWVSAVVMAAALGGLAFGLRRWSARPGWGQAQVLAVASGLVATYIWFGFLQVPSIGGADTATDLMGNAVFSLGALLILGWGWARLRREPNRAGRGQA